jgi:hypothetical protein
VFIGSSLHSEPLPYQGSPESIVSFSFSDDRFGDIFRSLLGFGSAEEEYLFADGDEVNGFDIVEMVFFAFFEISEHVTEI